MCNVNYDTIKKKKSINTKHVVIFYGATDLWALRVTRRRLENGLRVLLLPRFDSLPSPEVEVVGDHQGPGSGSGHGAEDGLGHSDSK